MNCLLCHIFRKYFEITNHTRAKYLLVEPGSTPIVVLT